MSHAQILPQLLLPVLVSPLVLNGSPQKGRLKGPQLGVTRQSDFRGVKDVLMLRSLLERKSLSALYLLCVDIERVVILARGLRMLVLEVPLQEVLDVEERVSRRSLVVKRAFAHEEVLVDSRASVVERGPFDLLDGLGLGLLENC